MYIVDEDNVQVSIFNKDVSFKQKIKFLILSVLFIALTVFVFFFVITFTVSYILPIIVAGTFKLSGLKTFAFDLGSFSAFVVPVTFLMAMLILFEYNLLKVVYRFMDRNILRFRKKYIKIEKSELKSKEI